MQIAVFFQLEQIADKFRSVLFRRFKKLAVFSLLQHYDFCEVLFVQTDKLRRRSRHFIAAVAQNGAGRNVDKLRSAAAVFCPVKRSRHAIRFFLAACKNLEIKLDIALFALYVDVFVDFQTVFFIAVQRQHDTVQNRGFARARHSADYENFALFHQSEINRLSFRKTLDSLYRQPQRFHNSSFSNSAINSAVSSSGALSPPFKFR